MLSKLFLVEDTVDRLIDIHLIIVLINNVDVHIFVDQMDDAYTLLVMEVYSRVRQAAMTMVSIPVTESSSVGLKINLNFWQRKIQIKSNCIVNIEGIFSQMILVYSLDHPL